jgi:hypothetical protein
MSGSNGVHYISTRLTTTIREQFLVCTELRPDPRPNEAGQGSQN